MACAVGMLVLLTVSTCWTIASRAWTQSENLGTAQSSTLALAYRLRQDYLFSMPGSTTVTGPLTSFLSDDLLSWDSTGTPQWSHWVQYRFVAATQEVQRRSYAISPPVTALPPGGPPLWPASDPGTLIGQAVTQFVVSLQGPCLLVNVGTTSGTATSQLKLGLLPQLYGQD